MMGHRVLWRLWAWGYGCRDTFPIVRRQDAAACGRYRTHDFILAYMNALAAGDTEAVVAL